MTNCHKAETGLSQGVLLFQLQVNIKEFVPGETVQNAATAGPPSFAPAEQYSQRLHWHKTQSERLHRLHIWTGNARVAIFALIIILCWTIGRSGKPSPLWLATAVLGFIVLVVVHRRILRARNLAERGIALYTRGLARLDDRWSGTGDTGEEFSRADHLYAEDLDIFGHGSLFQLLCSARSRMGKEQLSDWLLSQAGAAEVVERQQAVAELKTRFELRENLALAGDKEKIDADPTKLKHWAGIRVDLNYRRWWPLAWILSALAIGTLVFAVVGLVKHGNALWTPFLLMLVVNGIVLYSVRKRLKLMFAGLDEACHNLSALAAVLRCIEDEQFSAPRLAAIRQQLISHGLRASECISRLGTLCDLEESRHNQVVQWLELVILYSLHVALALQRWRERYAELILAWLDAVSEFEALNSVAIYAFEHPSDSFPEISDSHTPPRLDATKLRHPLMPSSECIPNDVTLGKEPQVLLVSGSNMSGKSTLLRSVGVNAVLALMGAPVRADAFRISALTIGASMRISDSLQKGVSHFYAEITRIRRVLELSRPGPLLFLFDEILQGTNSHDRRIGAEGVLRTLLQNGAAGLVTTHDLALTALEEMFPGKIANVHFQEKLEAGKLSFDYKLREGVVTTSNGLELMKSIGLQV
ncbi:MAG TPA: mismatch repair protein [Candidatus Angelobacter sp.]|nr:mismatch repair protein [Candidatus Angelobacter sp.]